MSPKSRPAELPRLLGGVVARIENHSMRATFFCRNEVCAEPVAVASRSTTQLLASPNFGMTQREADDVAAVNEPLTSAPRKT